MIAVVPIGLRNLLPMAILPICIVGEPVLHEPTAPVELDADGRPSAADVALLDDMYETMDAANGVGLAANSSMWIRLASTAATASSASSTAAPSRATATTSEKLTGPIPTMTVIPETLGPVRPDAAAVTVDTVSYPRQHPSTPNRTNGRIRARAVHQNVGLGISR